MQRGDADAWDALVREHQQAVFRLAWLMLGDADEAEDAAQETFINAYKARDRYDFIAAAAPVVDAHLRQRRPSCT